MSGPRAIPLRIALVTLLLALPLVGCGGGARVISGFGDRLDAERRPRDYAHRGVDVWGNPGDPVLASADGRVVVAQEAPRVAGQATCGKYVVLRHDFLVEGVTVTAATTYCHLSEYIVEADQEVKRGAVIGYIGYTGWRSRPSQPTGYEHVHWELRIRGGLQDSLSFTVGCFDPKKIYPTDNLVLTYPVKC